MKVIHISNTHLIGINKRYSVAQKRINGRIVPILILSNDYRKQLKAFQKVIVRPKELLLGSVSVSIDVKTSKDVDCVVKAVLDSMNGLVYRDDKQITLVVIKKTTIKRGQPEELSVRVEENQ